MQQAKDDNIPVIAFDSGVDSDMPVTTAATDNLAAAAEAAKHMAEAVGHEGKVAMVVHDQTSVTGLQRRDGFVDYMKENEPNIEIVDIQYGGGDQASRPTSRRRSSRPTPTSRASTARTRARRSASSRP